MDSATRAALIVAADRFDGTAAYNYVAAEDYPNAPAIADELRYMVANAGKP